MKTQIIVFLVTIFSLPLPLNAIMHYSLERSTESPNSRSSSGRTSPVDEHSEQKHNEAAMLGANERRNTSITVRRDSDEMGEDRDDATINAPVESKTTREEHDKEEEDVNSVTLSIGDTGGAYSGQKVTLTAPSHHKNSEAQVSNDKFTFNPQEWPMIIERLHQEALTLTELNSRKSQSQSATQSLALMLEHTEGSSHDNQVDKSYEFLAHQRELAFHCLCSEYLSCHSQRSDQDDDSIVSSREEQENKSTLQHLIEAYDKVLNLLRPGSIARSNSFDKRTSPQEDSTSIAFNFSRLKADSKQPDSKEGTLSIKKRGPNPAVGGVDKKTKIVRWNTTPSNLEHHSLITTSSTINGDEEITEADEGRQKDSSVLRDSRVDEDEICKLADNIEQWAKSSYEQINKEHITLEDAKTVLNYFYNEPNCETLLLTPEIAELVKWIHHTQTWISQAKKYAESALRQRFKEKDYSIIKEWTSEELTEDWNHEQAAVLAQKEPQYDIMKSLFSYYKNKAERAINNRKAIQCYRRRLLRGLRSYHEADRTQDHDYIQEQLPYHDEYVYDKEYNLLQIIRVDNYDGQRFIHWDKWEHEESQSKKEARRAFWRGWYDILTFWNWNIWNPSSGISSDISATPSSSRKFERRRFILP